jgi:uncharacterized membrane protein (DUF4010 family)
MNGLASGLLISWTVMFGRIAVEVAVVNAPLFWSIIVPIGATGLAAAAISGVFYLRSRRAEQAAAEEVPLKNPFSLTSALKFALLFTAVQLAVKLVETYLPGQGFYGVAAIAGLTDVDAITLSMADYAHEGDPQIAATSIIIAALSNTLVKCALVLTLGARALGLRVAAATAVLMVAGAVTLLIPPLKPIKLPEAPGERENRPDSAGLRPPSAHPTDWPRQHAAG